VQVRDHLRPKCEVRDEVTVHHVDVHPIGPGALDGLHGIAKMREIRRKDGRSQLHAGIMRE
jgi:hypothetical protein